MATYKQKCMHCGAMIDGDVHLCPICGTRSPFVYQCPTCLKPVERGHLVCSACGRSLETVCPYCGQPTFAGSDVCDMCRRSLLIRCESPRCGKPQFFENAKCTLCGKPIKKAKKQIERMKKGER